MERRKIQLVAGTTYSVSLPKSWVKQNNLKEQDEVVIYEKNDRTLVISALEIKNKNIKEITLPIDEYKETIEHVLFSVYYLGVEEIILLSKQNISKECRSKIRDVISHMSGTEITYEDSKKIVIKVLLDKSRVDVTQVLYRISLLLDLSLSCITEDFSLSEIKKNETEVDRLYHLMNKIISLSLIDASILNSSKINHVFLVPSYLLIAKKLENVGDTIKDLAKHLEKNSSNFEHKNEIIDFLRLMISKPIRHTLKQNNEIFIPNDSKNKEMINKKILSIKDQKIADYLSHIVRYLIDIEEEVINLSFYKKFIKDQMI